MKWRRSRSFPEFNSNPPPPVPRSKPRRSSSGRARDGERKVRGTRVSSKVRGNCGIGAITRGPGPGGESLVPFGHTDVSGCGFGLHPLTAPRGAREAGDRSTLALASSCEAGSEAARPLVAPDGTPAQPIFIREKYPTDSRGHTLGGLATETAHGEERTEAKDGDAVRGAVFESGGSPGTNARASAPRTGSGERAYHRVGGQRSWRERHDRRRRRGRPVRSQRCRVAAPRPHRLSASACARGGCAGACPGREGWLKRRSGGRQHATLREEAGFTPLKKHLNVSQQLRLWLCDEHTRTHEGTACTVHSRHQDRVAGTRSCWPRGALAACPGCQRFASEPLDCTRVGLRPSVPRQRRRAPFRPRQARGGWRCGGC